MATRTFVGDGASHNWSATGAWVEGIVPTAADDIVFSTNTAGSILVIDGTSGSPSLCRSIDTTNYTRTITLASAKQLNVGTSTSGAFKLTAGMTFAPNSGSLIKFVSTTTGNNITMAGYALGPVTFDGVGGGWQFQDANSIAAGTTLTLTNGALDTNSQTQTNNLIFSSSNSNTRSLTLGTTNFKLNASTGTVWDIGTATGMTLSAASSTITFNNTTLDVIFNGGGLTYGTMSWTSGLSGNTTVNGTNTWTTMTYTIVAGQTGSGYLILGNDQTVTGTFTSTGGSLVSRCAIAPATHGGSVTLSAGTFAITNTDLEGITAAGAGSPVDLSAVSSTTGNGNGGGNVNFTFAAPRTVFFKGVTNPTNWSFANWVTSSGGSTAATPPLPLLQDTAIFDANSNSAAHNVLVDMSRISGFNFTGAPSVTTFATLGSFTVYGDYILESSMTVSQGVNVFLAGRGAQKIDLQTKSPSSTFFIQNGTGSYALQSAFQNTGGLQVLSGTFNYNGFTVTATSPSYLFMSGGTVTGTGASSASTFQQTGGTWTLGGTMTLTGLWELQGGTFNTNGFGVTGNTTTLVSAGTLNLNAQINGSAGITLSGGTTNDSGAAGELKGTTFSCTGGTHTLRKLTLSSTFAQSSSGNITFPTGGNGTWATSWTETGTSYTQTAQGRFVKSNGAYTVYGDSYTFGN